MNFSVKQSIFSEISQKSWKNCMNN